MTSLSAAASSHLLIEWTVDETIPILTDFGMKVVKQVNEEREIKHPELDITTVDLAELYCHTQNTGCIYRNVVIFGDHMAGPVLHVETEGMQAEKFMHVMKSRSENHLYMSFIGFSVQRRYQRGSTG